MKSKELVVAGTLHHQAVEVVEAGEKKIYEAKVWVKPWLNFKELQDFKPAGDAKPTPSFTSSDLGVKKGTLFLPLMMGNLRECVLGLCRGLFEFKDSALQNSSA